MGDIHGSTFLTNAIGPELMVAFLDEYLLRMSTIVVNAGGAMDKSLGDSVMGVFGHFPDRPSETPISPAVRSLLAALQPGAARTWRAARL
jgi:class 3 adenylate cyclase